MDTLARIRIAIGRAWTARLAPAAVVLLLLLTSACSGATVAASRSSTQVPGSSAPSTAEAATASRQVTTGASGHVGAASLYPDPALTPGDVFPGVTAKEVCTPGYSKSVRNVSSAEKAEVYRRYGIVNEPGKHEVDHFISLELGGSNALTNLWPEPYEPRPGAHEKDTVENYLHAQMCNGSMTLSQAQNAIRTDWYAVYLQISPH